MSLSACGSGSDTPKEKEQTASAGPSVAGIPSPSRAESIDLVEQIDKVVPGAGQNAEQTVTRARDVCTSILGKAQNLEASTATRFSSSDQKISTSQAAALLDVIRDAPWCK